MYIPIPKWVVIATPIAFTVLFFGSLLWEPEHARFALVIGIILSMLMYTLRLEQLLKLARCQARQAEREKNHALGLTPDGKFF